MAASILVFRVSTADVVPLGPYVLATLSAASTLVGGFVDGLRFNPMGADDGRADGYRRAVSRMMRECAIACVPARCVRSSCVSPRPILSSLGGPNTMSGFAVACFRVATRLVSTAPGRMGVSRSLRGSGPVVELIDCVVRFSAVSIPRAAGCELSGLPVALTPTMLNTEGLFGDGVNALAEAGRLAARAAARLRSSMLVVFFIATGVTVPRCPSPSPGRIPGDPGADSCRVPSPGEGDSTGRTVKSTSTTTPSLFGGRPRGWSLRCRVR